MSVYFTVAFMIFCHIFDDYYLQGILAKMKQKSWWQENAPKKMYRNDYVAAMIAHSFSWAFMIMLPIAIYNSFDVSWAYFLAFLLNAFVHAIVDDLKANQLKINLVTDQAIHLAQVVVTALIFVK